MDFYPAAIEKLIDEFAKLPGIGYKTAQRLTLHVLNLPQEEVTQFAEALIKARGTLKFCSVCGNIAQEDQCSICRDPRRSRDAICVVEEAKDVVAIERTRQFRGLYHVLGGAISPIDGIGPEQLRIALLLERLRDTSISEIILATDPNVEGEATATYLIRLLEPLGIRITRLASGLPVGGDLEYADEVTLGRAFEHRTRVAGA